MIERLLITLVLIAAAYVLYRLFIMFQLSKASAVLPGLEGKEPGKFLILYFTSPTCGPCRTTQRPALEKVKLAFGDQVQIITVDVTEQPDAAAHWNVMTLPTTYVFDATGAPREYNFGVTYADRLIKQIAGLGARVLTLQNVSA